jgi:hypothetical protein
MSEIAEILRRARAKIERSECWTQGNFAIDKDGCTVNPEDSAAVCWCGYGALINASGEPLSNSPMADAAQAVLENTVGVWFPDWQDDRTHAEVLAAFDRAIAASEGAQP